jgi:hypothetical protein
MPRAPNERPSRRLDAYLDTLRRHGVMVFKAGKLEGVGEGLEFEFGPMPSAPPVNVTARAASDLSDPDLVEREHPGAIDELDLVAQGREGPVPENGVS